LKVAIVILNWNGRILLEKFIPTLLKFSSSEADIYVADNDSNDDSIAYLRSNFPQIKIIQNKENGGYAKGYNDALKHIDADIYALVNSDIEVTDGWLAPIIDQVKKNSKTVVIQPKILDYKNKSKFEYAGAAGGFVDFMGYPYCRGRIFMNLETDVHQYDDTCDIFWATGACFFIRASVYHEMNGFDEDYFAHQEEIDLCWRIQNEGFDIQYVGSSKVYHIGGATLRETNPHKTFLNFRNSLYTISKNVPKRFLFFVIMLRLLLDGIAGIKFIFELRPVHTWAIVKAHFSFYKHLPLMLRKRRKISFKKTNYYQCFSIVWQHFILGRIKFTSIK
jgi:GT2 family glycosyltransferase